MINPSVVTGDDLENLKSVFSCRYLIGQKSNRYTEVGRRVDGTDLQVEFLGVGSSITLRDLFLSFRRDLHRRPKSGNFSKTFVS